MTQFFNISHCTPWIRRRSLSYVGQDNPLCGLTGSVVERWGEAGVWHLRRNALHWEAETLEAGV